MSHLLRKTFFSPTFVFHGVIASKQFRAGESGSPGLNLSVQKQSCRAATHVLGGEGRHVFGARDRIRFSHVLGSSLQFTASPCPSPFLTLANQVFCGLCEYKTWGETPQLVLRTWTTPDDMISRRVVQCEGQSMLSPALWGVQSCPKGSTQGASNQQDFGGLEEEKYVVPGMDPS